MRAEIVSIGTELLLGEIVDTNSAWLAASLADAGYDVYWSQRVGDNLDRVVEALRLALGRSDIVVTSGGLGSTDDDLTRAAVAAVVGETPLVDDAREEHLREWFARGNLPFQALMLKQAERIPSSTFLDNRVGTAAGWWVPIGKRLIVTLPGPPRELQAMWTEQVLPRLPHPSASLFRRVIKTCGLGEGRVFEALGDDLIESANPSVATYAKKDGVHVRVAAKAEDAATAEALAAPVVARVRERLAGFVWGADDDSLVGCVAQMLRAQGQWLSTIESISGGMMAREITAVSGVSDVYRGGIVAYDSAVKARVGVSVDTLRTYGAVSEQTAIEMASSCARFMQSDFAVSTTGVAGPTELEGKPVGTVFMAVHGPRGTCTRHVTYASRSREQVQERATFTALALLWRVLAQG